MYGPCANGSESVGRDGGVDGGTTLVAQCPPAPVVLGVVRMAVVSPRKPGARFRCRGSVRAPLHLRIQRSHGSTPSTHRVASRHVCYVGNPVIMPWSVYHATHHLIISYLISSHLICSINTTHLPLYSEFHSNQRIYSFTTCRHSHNISEY